LQSFEGQSASARPPAVEQTKPAQSAKPAPAAPAATAAKDHIPSKNRGTAPELTKRPEKEAAIDLDACLEQIWEQLIATPPTRGRSMTTVKMGKARILMSSWEVMAFVSEDGPAAEDLRRAVAARAIVSSAVEAAKEAGNAAGMSGALSVARREVARLQERVDEAKRAKDTEAAVNLGISTKRLLSALDEAEKL